MHAAFIKQVNLNACLVSDREETYSDQKNIGSWHKLGVEHPVTGDGLILLSRRPPVKTGIIVFLYTARWDSFFNKYPFPVFPLQVDTKSISK